MTDTQRETWSLEDAFTQHASKEAQAEANAFRTVPTGIYKLTPAKHELVKTDEKSFFGPGLRMVHVTYDAEATFTLDGKTPKTKLFVDYCIDEKREERGGKLQLIGPSALFLQAQKGLDAADKTLAETIEAIALYPLNGYISETVILEGQGEGVKSSGAPKDKYINIKADGSRNEQLAEALKQGGKPKNFLQNVSKAK